MITIIPSSLTVKENCAIIKELALINLAVSSSTRKDKKDEESKQMKNQLKICRSTLNGGTCMRYVCQFFHPANMNDSVELPPRRNTSGFHPESLKKPPFGAHRTNGILTIEETMSKIPNLSPRVSVRNLKKQPTQMKDLSQSLGMMKLN